MDILEAKLLQLIHGPSASPGLCRGAGQTRANLGRQVFNELEAHRIRRGSIHQGFSCLGNILRQGAACLSERRRRHHGRQRHQTT